MKTTMKETVKQRAVVKKSSSTAVVRSDWMKELQDRNLRVMKMAENDSASVWFSTRGGKLSYRGMELPHNEVRCAILAVLKENVYFEDTYDPDVKVSPVCFAFSLDGENMEPHEKVHEKQSETCAECPHNEWGSDGRGKGKACKNVVRLALIPFDERSTPEAVAGADIACIRISVTAVKNWRGFVNSLADKGGPLSVHTRISLERDEGRDYSSLHFELASPRPFSDNLLRAVAMRQDEALRLLEAPYPWLEPAPKRSGKAAGAKKAKY